MDVTICVSTFGSDYWRDLGLEKARQTSVNLGCGVINVHLPNSDSLAESRNAALSLVHTEYVIFLDADDELEIHYLEAMSKGIADVLVPSVRYRRNGVLSVAHLPRVVPCSHEGLCGPQCLPLGNYVVIGACARADALRAVGGFRDWPIYEDWDLWLRIYKAGFTFENVLDAIYIAIWSATSRNRGPTQAIKNETHRAIAQANGV